LYNGISIHIYSTRTGGTYNNSTHESGVQQYHDLSHFNPVIIWQNLPMAFSTVSKNSNNFLPAQHNLLDIDSYFCDKILTKITLLHTLQMLGIDLQYLYLAFFGCSESVFLVLFECTVLLEFYHKLIALYIKQIVLHKGPSPQKLLHFSGTTFCKILINLGLSLKCYSSYDQNW